MSKSIQWDKDAPTQHTHTHTWQISGVLSPVQWSSSHFSLSLSSPVSLWDFLTPSFLQFLSLLPSQDAPFLYFHPMFSSFYVVFQNQSQEMLLSCSPPSISFLLLSLAGPHRHLYFPPDGVLFLMNYRLTTVCILPSDASSSSPSENREIQYELLSLLQGQDEGEGKGKRERQKEINRPERRKKRGGRWKG